MYSAVGTLRGDRDLGLRDIFRRKPADVGRAPATGPGQDNAPLPPELAVELQEAWADLQKAAKDTKVLNLHGCTGGGRDWRQDPSSVRAAAALLRKYGSSDEPAS
jgi:hypothetical protein